MTKDEFMRVSMKRERGDESAGEVDPFNGILIKWGGNMKKKQICFFPNNVFRLFFKGGRRLNPAPTN